ncbi:ATP-dependent RNA helicase dbp4 [Tilletia horrida]|nr:ATP-dependent RNA helicase dbp4 [Tilletia horrida]
MSFDADGSSRKRKRGFNSRSKDARAIKRTALDEHIADLDRRAAAFDPAAAAATAAAPQQAEGRQPPNKKHKAAAANHLQHHEGILRYVSHFKQLPLSNPTAQGLRTASFTTCTPIQARAIPLALKGKDVLAAAPTGSGKTLAFLIPVLDVLFRKRWGPADGLGALIISPTRELAIQIFNVLRKIGTAHTFSAGLVIGGKDLQTEQERLARINILVATPGRLLQHMDQTVDFDTSNVQMLVLDEADRILDMGFAATLNAIVENLPKKRQTLLFSATQTRRVQDLARLSLVEPEFVAVSNAPSDPSDPTSTPAVTGDEDATSAANSLPANLSQNYMVVPLPQKLSTLFSFLRTHTQSKCIVFLSSCRQVQFVHSTFCKLRPGVSLLCLHGKQKQAKRLQIFEEFRKTKHAVLFATDIAARGLDFPAVDWVIQLDAPEDAATYVHRVGRTARYQSKGNSLLFACPSEEKGLVAMLGAKGIEPNKIKPKESKLQSIDNQLQSYCFQETELKYLAQKAFVSYVRSIHLQRDKATYDVLAYPLEEFAASLGLPGAPKVKFIKEVKKAREKEARTAAKAAAAAAATSAADEEDGARKEDGKVRTKYDRMFNRTNQGVLSEHYAKLVADEDEDEHDQSWGSDSDSEAASDDEAAPEDGYGHAADLLEGASAIKQGSKSTSQNGDDDADDFLTLKRVDHALSDDEEEAPIYASSVQPNGTTSADKVALARAHLPLAEEHLSKRKLLQGRSKKAMAAAGMRGGGDKLIFDDDGTARSAYAITSEDAFLRDIGGEDGRGLAREMQRFEETERERLRERDVEDKERAREKRREKKRREKERAREADGAGDSDDEDGGAVPIYEAPEDTRDDGYETPDFDLPDNGDDGQDGESDFEEPQAGGSAHRSFVKPSSAPRAKQQAKAKAQARSTLTDEELALRLLSGTA